jgi:hypothetical protein
MRGLVPRIHVFGFLGQDVDGRDEHGHDAELGSSPSLMIRDPIGRGLAQSAIAA